MTLRAGELFAVCSETEAALAGQAVQKVVQPDDETVLLGFPRGWLLLSCSARAGRIHLTSKPAGTGEAAPSFCMLLRKHLVGTRLAAVRAVEGERACELELLSPAGDARLRLFLFGPAAQLQLVAAPEDGDPARILGSIGPARRVYEALPAPHPRAAATQADRFEPRADATVSQQIAGTYDVLVHHGAVEEARKRAQARLLAERKRAARLAENLELDLQRTADAEGRRKEADLLLAHLHEVPRGARQVVLPDDFTGEGTVTIALDPARSARDNAERLYKEHRRLHRARAALEVRLADARTQVQGLDVRLAALEGLGDEQLLADARPATQPPPQRRDRTARALPYKAFTSKSGVPIYVGRGAARNDELTFKVARGNDLWLHTRDVAGAHVVVPLPGGHAVDPETLVDAATLAVHHSPARDEAQVDVGYALRKHVRKPKGAPPGSVLVSQQKTVRVRMEPARLKRLLATVPR